MATTNNLRHEIRTRSESLNDMRSKPLDSMKRLLVRDLNPWRESGAAVHIEWSPETLRTLQVEELPGTQIIVVSNREPYIHNWSGRKVALQTPASGLVSALEPVTRACGGTWIAHGHGSADRETVDQHDRVRVPPAAPAYTLRRIWLEEEEQDGYYYGFANEGLWPLCHIAFVRPKFRETDWRTYTAVNQRFADAVASEAKCDDPIVLVQDYHFALLPRMVREHLPRATIVTFWHIPWPNAECFGICPWKEEIVRGLLSSTILGFHTRYHCNNFLETVDRFIECRIDREASAVIRGGEETMIRAYPISIEWPSEPLVRQRPVIECRSAIRSRLGLADDMRLAVGVERLDYTKGIAERMRAIGALFELHPDWVGRLAFVQAAAPSRSKLPQYRRLQAEVMAIADQLNAKYGSDGYQPVHLILRHHEPDEVLELFRAADVCIVSSLHDGMNLVAKEFVAARDDDQGVLVLSSFAGAARELTEALIVNPYDQHAMGEALHRALTMPESEQRERIRHMRAQVRDRNVYRWAGQMLMDAAHVRRRQRIVEVTEGIRNGNGN
jgi:trehalose 6-phosphate synthase